MLQHRAGGKETTIPATAIDYGYLNERDDLLQEAAGAPIGSASVILIEYAVAEPKNDVSGFTEFSSGRTRSRRFWP